MRLPTERHVTRMAAGCTAWGRTGALLDTAVTSGQDGERIVDGDLSGQQVTCRDRSAVVAVLRAHLPGGGWCQGCLDRWGRFEPYPCAPVRWAAGYVAAHPDLFHPPHPVVRAGRAWALYLICRGWMRRISH